LPDCNPLRAALTERALLPALTDRGLDLNP
jgi:hypothetical protein